MKKNKHLISLIVVLLSIGIPTQTFSASKEDSANNAKKSYSPYAGHNYPTRPLFGDQHLHSSWSADAIATGTRVSPEQAFRFARGEEIISTTGVPAKLSRPLDWLALTDHSDGMGFMSDVLSGKPSLMSDPILKEWHRKLNAGPKEAMEVTMDLIARQSNGQLPDAATDPRTLFEIWPRYTAFAEQYNEPGRFTAFIAYEWTSNAGGGDNLHRNIIYRDGKQIADMVPPMTTFDSENPEDLWKWMEDWTARTGGQILAIPHNGNLSNGRMFSLKTFNDKELTAAWSRARAKWEPLYEITQSKGTSEQHPSISPTDEFLNFEIWDKGNLLVVPKKPSMIKSEYAREALKNGLTLEKKLGTNPFKYGMVGGTDSHTGLTTPEENNFFGKFLSSEPSPERWREDAFNFGKDRIVKGWKVSASGSTAVWATENTRESIWDAMKRKEVYSTTGPRITVRFFGAYDFTAEDAAARDIALIGYDKGVSMGGELGAVAGNKSPTFLIAALKDPLSANLDRIQIIKGWVDKKGKTYEKVYDAVWGDADKRKQNSDGKLTSVGNTVNAEKATWTNTIGDAELTTVWTDPDFDPSLSAFYYARVIEIPTPRWTTYDAVKFGIKIGDEVPVSIQERAFTSPIWYTP